MTSCTARRCARKKIGVKAIKIFVIGAIIDAAIVICPVTNYFAVAVVT
jgi:hypothetical protein